MAAGLGPAQKIPWLPLEERLWPMWERGRHHVTASFPALSHLGPVAPERSRQRLAVQLLHPPRLRRKSSLSPAPATPSFRLADQTVLNWHQALAVSARGTKLRGIDLDLSRALSLFLFVMEQPADRLGPRGAAQLP
ncbi:hypothetical protein J1614_004221 [Plenodomus biglobosus]|nr:hypothetical protein J1614_004221 [Plenodomus biglobosus]